MPKSICRQVPIVWKIHIIWLLVCYLITIWQNKITILGNLFCYRYLVFTVHILIIFGPDVCLTPCTMMCMDENSWREADRIHWQKVIHHRYAYADYRALKLFWYSSSPYYDKCRLFFLGSIVQFFTYTYMNCFFSS